jgi:HK97 family phage major capsid protein
MIEERDGVTRSRLSNLESSLNDVMRRMGRPHGGNGFGDVDSRKSAIEMLRQKHFSSQTKIDPSLPPPDFSESQISEAQTAICAIKTLLHSTSIDMVPHEQRKALSAFSFGSQGFLMAPEMSQQILSCLTEVTDITGLMNNVSISSSAIKFMVDNEHWDFAAWACDASCFANSPTQQLGAGLGEMEIKAESLRYIVCATRELLEDSAVNIESWALDKAARAFRAQISAAVLAGDGFGKPLGILHPAAGIPIVETASGTEPGQFTWQDLMMLRWQIPQNFQDANAAYIMNQNTWGQASTLSDTTGRPIMTMHPTEAVPFRIGGAPVVVSNMMPDCAPGALPVAFGNWRQAYTVVNRKGVTVQNDPFSAGFCTLLKFDARVGGAVTCPNAARLLRIR